MTDSEHDDADPYRRIKAGIDDILQQLHDMRAEAKADREASSSRLTKAERRLDDHDEDIGRIKTRIESEPRIAITLPPHP